MPAVVYTMDTDPFQAGSQMGRCLLVGKAQEMDTHYNIQFVVEITDTDSAQQITSKLEEALIAQFALANITILSSDKKTKL